jgi:hypothetical protein
MCFVHRYLASASLLLLVATTTFARDDTDLIDDLPKERKEAAREKAQPKKGRPQVADSPRPVLPRPNVDLIDDLSPEQKEAAQKEAAERNAARKNENAIPDNLADALARALRASPAILVADAKVRQAQAELNEVRLSVVQEMTLTFQRRASNKAALEQHEAAFKSGRETTLAAAQVHQAILEDETRILYLLGVGAESSAEAHVYGRPGAGGGAGTMGMMSGMGAMGGMPGMSAGMSGGPMGAGGMMSGEPMGAAGMSAGMSGGPMGAGAMGAGPMGAGGVGGRMMRGMGPGRRAKEQGEGAASNLPENVRAFLDKRVDADFVRQPLDDVLAYLDAVNDSAVAFVIETPDEWNATEEDSGVKVHAVTLSLKQVTVRSLLQALADLHHCAFVFRDYGILVLGPCVDDTEPFESFKAAGTPMVGPPSPLPVVGSGQF